jgi:hypothetical protein
MFGAAAYLFTYDLRNARVAVAERIDSNASGKV